MKTISILVINLILLGFFYSCSSQNKEERSTRESLGKVDVYYFHYTRRCITCNAVEDEARKTIEQFYSEKFKNGEITFTSVNLDEDEGKAVGDKIGASSQALLIIKGDTKIDLTNDGFMNARTNPEKYREIVKKEIDKLL